MVICGGVNAAKYIVILNGIGKNNQADLAACHAIMNAALSVVGGLLLLLKNGKSLAAKNNSKESNASVNRAIFRFSYYSTHA